MTLRLYSVVFCALSLACLRPAFAEAPPVQASEDTAHITMDNGTVALEILKRNAQIVSIRYRHGGRETTMGKSA